MKCETDGNPQPQFEFTKDVRADLVPSAQCYFVWAVLSLTLVLYLFFMQGRTLASGTGLFILRNVTRSDSGTYTCEAQDFDADNVELTKTLTITVHRE